jgi:hypothetical protein
VKIVDIGVDVRFLLPFCCREVSVPNLNRYLCKALKLFYPKNNQNNVLKQMLTQIFDAEKKNSEYANTLYLTQVRYTHEKLRGLFASVRTACFPMCFAPFNFPPVTIPDLLRHFPSVSFSPGWIRA